MNSLIAHKFSLFRVVAWLLMTGVWSGGCRDRPPAAIQQPKNNAGEKGITPGHVAAPKVPNEAANEAANEAWRTAQFCVRAVQMQRRGQAAFHVTGLVLDESWLRQTLAQVAELSGPSQDNNNNDPAACRSAPPAQQLGVAVTLSYAGTSATGALIAPVAQGAATGLYVAAKVHVERAGPDGRAEMADSTVEATGPLVAADQAGLRRRLSAKLAAATRQATRRALGQLWMRHQPEALVLATLKEGDPWRRAAALQEVAERGLVDAVDAVEKAAGSSRADIAVVACATLGRLGRPRSVPVLTRALRNARVEVADSALYALKDMATPTARAAIKRAAQDHPSTWIRLRAKALLDAKPTRP